MSLQNQFGWLTLFSWSLRFNLELWVILMRGRGWKAFWICWVGCWRVCWPFKLPLTLNWKEVYHLGWFSCLRLPQNRNWALHTCRSGSRWFLQRKAWTCVDRNWVLGKIFPFSPVNSWTSFRFSCWCSRLACSRWCQCGSTLSNWESRGFAGIRARKYDSKALMPTWLWLAAASSRWGWSFSGTGCLCAGWLAGLLSSHVRCEFCPISSGSPCLWGSNLTVSWRSSSIFILSLLCRVSIP